MNDLTGDLNWYDLYRPKYGEGLSAKERKETVIRNGKEVEYTVGYTMREYTPFMKHMIPEAKEGEREAVMGTNATRYMNDPEVMKALHLENFTGPWH